MRSLEPITIWKYAVLIVFVSITLVGGVTRLTHSGLSIANWRPIAGALPPITSADWISEFSQYQATPEYRVTNPGMTITEYRSIFIWEYAHRQLARLAFLSVLLPFLFLLVKKKVSRNLTNEVLVLLFLIGLQGIAGWLMVNSGLTNRPAVSHFRLATHLGLGMILIGYTVLWIRDSSYLAIRWTQYSVLSALVFFQILLGALTAGLHAGHFFNTFPKMGSRWVPELSFSLSDPTTVQWLHRWGGAVILSLVVYQFIGAFFTKKQNSPPQTPERSLRYSNGIYILSFIAIAQFTLGVITILQHTPLSLALLHQGGAILLFSISLIVAHKNRTLTSKGLNIK